MPYSDLRKGRYSLSNQEYLVTTVCRGRRPFFRDQDTALRLAECCRQLEREGRIGWLAWIIMPDHFHGLFVLGETESLQRVMQLLKGRSSRAAGRGRLWQPAYHDHAVRAETSRLEAARYIIENPIRAGIVDRLEQYPHWYCAWPL